MYSLNTYETLENCQKLERPTKIAIFNSKTSKFEFKSKIQVDPCQYVNLKNAKADAATKCALPRFEDEVIKFDLQALSSNLSNPRISSRKCMPGKTNLIVLALDFEIGRDL